MQDNAESVALADERERREHALIRAFHHWDDKPTALRLLNLKGAVEELWALLNDGLADRSQS